MYREREGGFLDRHVSHREEASHEKITRLTDRDSQHTVLSN